MSRRTEEWRDIPGFDGLYQVSDWGSVRSFNTNHGKSETPKLLKAAEYGYRQYVNLKRNGRQHTMQIARAVALAFIGPIPSGMVAYHKNGDFRDNSAWNVGIGVRKELSRERMRKHTARKNRRPVVKLNRSLEVVEAYPSVSAAAKANGYRQDYMHRLVEGDIEFSVFAPDDYLYAYDEDRHIKRTVRRAMAELDAMGAYYNSPLIYGLYHEAPPEPEVDSDAIWQEALPIAGGASHSEL